MKHDRSDMTATVIYDCNICVNSLIVDSVSDNAVLINLMFLQFNTDLLFLHAHFNTDILKCRTALFIERYLSFYSLGRGM